jgi:hypothetical protein
MILLLLLTSFAWADPSLKWTNAIDVVEKHEFYQNHEVIKKPKGSWQTLFGVIYRDNSLRTQKDCLYFRVPGDEPGELKIKNVSVDTRCEVHLFSPGDQTWTGLKAFQFAVLPERLSVSLTLGGYKSERWDVPLMNVFRRPSPKSGMSSADYRAPKIFFLSPKQNSSGDPLIKLERLKDKDACHVINEQCQETSKSICDQCPAGWYEIPNGCDQGPKFCGELECGGKNQPACRRGTKWQRRDGEYECRRDDSFAFCAKGLRVQCNGNLPFCL